ncbi:MAG TPA: thiamine phosphate synthase [Candidatus Acidoferrales bacterium]|jgi:thiamine-phosphate pyrophosphorylase|nr:thiamine phosphate synthase [Candidatus Acidoferrales bacterium]
MNPVFPRLYAILDAGLLPDSPPAFARMLAQSGVELIQYRNKNSSTRALFDVSSRITHELRGAHARLIVNDRADVARLAGAGGVHVGQEDLPAEAERAVFGNWAGNGAGGGSFWVGVSTHTLEQVRAAEATSADYIAIGPIFATATKERPEAVVGAEFIRRARALTRKPLVAIGGITVERAAEVFRAGADCVAVARDLICAADPGARARDYLAVSAKYFSMRGAEALDE